MFGGASTSCLNVGCRNKVLVFRQIHTHTHMRTCTHARTTHTHTHTHTNTEYWYCNIALLVLLNSINTLLALNWQCIHTHTPSTVDFFSPGFTPNRGHTLQSFHGWPWTLCVCVCVCVWVLSNHALSLYPYVSPWLELFFSHPCLCDLLPIEGSLTIVDVHGWCVSTVSLWYFCVHRWRCLQTHTHKFLPSPKLPTYSIIEQCTPTNLRVRARRALTPFKWCSVENQKGAIAIDFVQR